MFSVGAPCSLRHTPPADIRGGSPAADLCMWPSCVALSKCVTDITFPTKLIEPPSPPVAAASYAAFGLMLAVEEPPTNCFSIARTSGNHVSAWFDHHRRQVHWSTAWWTAWCTPCDSRPARPVRAGSRPALSVTGPAPATRYPAVTTTHMVQSAMPGGLGGSSGQLRAHRRCSALELHLAPKSGSCQRRPRRLRLRRRQLAHAAEHLGDPLSDRHRWVSRWAGLGDRCWHEILVVCAV